MNNTPEEIYVEQDIDDGCVYEHWYDSDKVPIEVGARLVKYIYNDKYQKAVDAIKYIYKSPIRRSDPYFAFPQINDICKDTLQELGEIE
jgi:hypothetical protein